MAQKEKLEEAKRLYQTANADQRYVLESLFPELKESEDERIRKELIFYLRYQHSINENFEDIGKWIAWLEKQGEHKKFRDSIQVGDEVTRNSDGVIVNLSQLKRVAKKSEQKLPIEKLPSEMKTIRESLGFTTQKECDEYNQMVSDLIMSDSKVEQKPTCLLDNSKSNVEFPFKAKVKRNGKIVTIYGGQLSMNGKEWIKYQSNKEDGYMVYEPEDLELVYNIEQKPVNKIEPKFKAGDKVIGIVSDMQYYITDVCYDHYYTESGCIIMFCSQDNFKLVEQKPAWNEEDETIISALSQLLKDCELENNWNCVYSNDREVFFVDIVNWLKSLRPQPKQEWSKEDENILQGIWDEILANKHNAKEYEWKTYDKFLDWLKSIKQRICG